MEEWRPVVGYEGYYEVSNLGRVRSVDHVVKVRYGKTGTKRGMIRKHRFYGKYKYCRVDLSRDNNISTYLVHRLVAEAFIPNPENKSSVNHKNGNKEDNRSDNLEWVTHKENTHHAINSGLINAKGENNANAKLNSNDVIKIRSMAGAISQSKIGLLFGVSQRCICKILHNQMWAHVV